MSQPSSPVGIVYPSPIFGPVHSRRLGVSLGINLMPSDGKLCTFDCLYCECGFNADHRPAQPRPSRQQVAAALEARLQQMQADGPAQPFWEIFPLAAGGETPPLRPYKLGIWRFAVGAFSAGR